jgi:hypothetical protein
MVFSAIFQRFVDQRPVAVMTRIVLEKQFSDKFFDTVFEEIAEEQYMRDLGFSTCAKIMTQITLGNASSVHAVFVKDRETIPVSLVALYAKLQHVEPRVCEELVRRSALELTEVVGSLATRQEPVRGYRLRVVDGNVLAASEHRLKELRGSRTAAMPGMTLAVYDYATSLITDLVACEDGQASERRLCPELLARFQANDLMMSDRNFCTAQTLTTLSQKQARFLIRYHAGLSLERQGSVKKCGRCKTGEVSEQTVRLKCGFVCRAIIITRDKPLKKGGSEVILLTNVPLKKAAASKLATLYLERWSIEEAFRQLTEYLSCEVNTLGYPRAALFAFTLAVLGYNTLTCVKAALEGAQPDKKKGWSAFYMAWEVKSTFEGMLIAVLPEEWAVFGTLSNEALAKILHEIAKGVKYAHYAKHKRGPKKSIEVKRRKSYHESTAKVLEKRKLGKTKTKAS